MQESYQKLDAQSAQYLSAKPGSHKALIKGSARAFSKMSKMSRTTAATANITKGYGTQSQLNPRRNQGAASNLSKGSIGRRTAVGKMTKPHSFAGN